MNLYKLSQNARRDWDTYDSCVVAAESEEDACTIHPSGDGDYINFRPHEWDNGGIQPQPWSLGDWADNPREVRAVLIGEATEGTARGVIIASFNAG
jgi:hypothetical protein